MVSTHGRPGTFSAARSARSPPGSAPGATHRRSGPATAREPPSGAAERGAEPTRRGAGRFPGRSSDGRPLGRPRRRSSCDGGPPGAPSPPNSSPDPQCSARKISSRNSMARSTEGAPACAPDQRSQSSMADMTFSHEPTGTWGEPAIRTGSDRIKPAVDALPNIAASFRAVPSLVCFWSRERFYGNAIEGEGPQEAEFRR